MSGTHGALRLIELISARLCHEVSGFANELDRVPRTSVGQSAGAPAFEKTVLSAAQALITRLALRRAAWGPDGDPISLERLQFLAHGLPEQVSLNISALDPDTVFSASAGRVVLNLLLLGAESLPSGGTIALAGAADDLFVQIAGPAAAWPAGLAECLVDHTKARSALTEWRGLQMALTALLAHAAQTRLSVLVNTAARTEPAILRLGG